MSNNFRIIISTSSLNIEDWTDLYNFIDSIFTNDRDETKRRAALNRLVEREMRVHYASESNSDIYQLDGKELKNDNNVLMQIRNDTCFTILYQKCDDTEEFTGFAPFVLFLRKFMDKSTKRSFVSLGINTDGMLDQIKATNFYFKFSNFFILYQGMKPVIGYRTLYFFSEKNHSITSLAGKRKGSEYYGDPNRRFLPLLQITEDNYHSIFTDYGISTNENSRDYSYIKDSLSLIKNDFKNKIFNNQESKLDLIVNESNSLFGQWLINGYFFSYGSDELRNMCLDEVEGIVHTLQVYIISIFELIQNIMFHGGKSGLFYCVFDKKENMSPYYRNKLPDFGNDESKVKRFLRVGIYDYHETGILDSFKEREGKRQDAFEDYNNLSLIDFFEPSSIATVGITKLDMRYAARLGIKSFVKTVFKHRGFFCVESNEVANGLNKKRLTPMWKDKEPSFKSESIDFVAGTHYEIILPIIPPDDNQVSAPALQLDSILNFRKTLQNQLTSTNPIMVIDLDFNEVSNISNSEDKRQQIDAIIKIGNNIIKSAGSKRDDIALNLNGKDIDHKLVFKILAYLQLKAQEGFKKIILIKATDRFVSDFCELINSTLLLNPTSKEEKVWKRDRAIILMSEKLHVQIICGETKNELHALNHEFQKYYCNNFTEKTDLSFNLASQNVSKPSIESISKAFILPYDILAEPKDRFTPFESYSIDLLRRKIISNNLGFLVNHENTYIGNKIIVKNYYEADMMFQNSFFAERFAYLIAKELRKTERKPETDLVLIGYQHYSEYLLKSIIRIMDDKTIHIAIANEDAFDSNTINKSNHNNANGKDESEKKVNGQNAEDRSGSTDIDMSFNFDIDGKNSRFREKIIKSPEQFQFATIVPIGATLSTNDKIIALFKLWHKLNDQEKRETTAKIDFIYNHCVILVRDTIKSQLTKLEVGQKWTGIDLNQRMVNTEFQNAKEIHYTIQIANTSSSADNSVGDCTSSENIVSQQGAENLVNRYSQSENWLRRLNSEVSFPIEWQSEEYVNYTENTSINSQNLMGFPKVSHLEESVHQEELNRLYQFRRDIFKGHFNVFKSHHKYFFDTESFVRKNFRFIKWLLDIKDDSAFNQKKLNILITPNAETESDLICAVNDRIFGGNALIIYLDVKNWRNNIVHKLSFLKNMDKTNISFHYIDHILLTGETYHRTKSYLYSIIGDQNTLNSGKNKREPDDLIGIQNKNHLELERPNNGKQEVDNKNNPFIVFDSIIAVINRLPYTKGKEIKNDVNDHIFTFINLYYPTSKLDGRECELCKLKDYYEDLSKKTVLDSCKQVIDKNVKKLFLKSRRDIEELKDKKYSQKSKRDFLRLVMTHELFFRISEIVQNNETDFDLSRIHVFHELDAIYHQLCYGSGININKTIRPITPKSNINEYIDNWFQYKVEDEYSDLRQYYDKKLETDKKISFLKVISSPPLSKYIILREYAHRKLLCALYELIHEKNDNYTYDDLKIVKSLLKSLSFLKSNALVRKDVIVGAWKILDNVIKYLENKAKTDIEDLESRIEQTITIIDAELEKLNNKTQLTISEGERRNYLISAKTHSNIYFKYLDKDKKEIDLLITKKNEIIKDFSRDVQFFIKNAIVEDDAKATFLGELIRKGDEPSLFDIIKISKTKLSTKISINQNDKNNLFEYFQNKDLYQDEVFRKEYIDFLVWLFYDNTTIIRRTLENISKELVKDSDFKLLFYANDNNTYKLKSIKELSNCFSKIYMMLKEKINHEYYYSSFQPYLDNEDDYDFVKKLIYVTYAKLKLEDLIINKHKTSIETDLKVLLEIFSEIMGANGAFIAIKNGKKLNPVTLYNKMTIKKETQSNLEEYKEDEQKEDADKTDHEFDYDDWLFYNYYSKRYINKTHLVYPFNPLFNIRGNVFGEKRNLNAHSLNVFIIEDPNTKARATITFLYHEDNPLANNVFDFRINVQESGRLLLLLKNEIDEYVINYLINEKVFNLWLEKQKNLRKFEKIYSKSAHIFRSVYAEMEEFENLNEETIRIFSKTWFFLTNETISFFYSNIEKNASPQEESKHHLDIHSKYVIDPNNTLGKTFNNSYLAIIRALLESRWSDVPNEIYINNRNIMDKDCAIEPDLVDKSINCNKHLLRTFIVQFLHNSLSPKSKHGHRGEEEVKRIFIEISKSSIAVKDTCIQEFYSENAKKNISKQFNKKKKYILQMNCNEYSSTTLTSLQGFVNYMKDECKDIHCSFGFNDQNNFELTINF